MRATFGTNKYCLYFLNNRKCMNKDCKYLHEIAKIKEDIIENPRNVKF